MMTLIFLLCLIFVVEVGLILSMAFMGQWLGDTELNERLAALDEELRKSEGRGSW